MECLNCRPDNSYGLQSASAAQDKSGQTGKKLK